MACCNNNKANNSIQCTVTECKYHCNDCNYCTLSSIKVGSHEPNPTMAECTDCQSFMKK